MFKCSWSIWPVAGFTIIDVQQIHFPSSSSRQLHDLLTISEDLIKYHSQLPVNKTSPDEVAHRLTSCLRVDV